MQPIRFHVMVVPKVFIPTMPKMYEYKYGRLPITPTDKLIGAIMDHVCRPVKIKTWDYMPPTPLPSAECKAHYCVMRTTPLPSAECKTMPVFNGHWSNTAHLKLSRTSNGE